MYSQNGVEMNVSYKPKDHNIEVPAYSLNLLPSNDLHNVSILLSIF